jgi:tetratricopeptide (TPR) repeat protein
MPRANHALTLAPGLVSMALLLSAPPANADEPPSPQSADVAVSERLAARAFEAYRQKDYLSAVQLYRQALEAAPSADIVYNLARVYDNGLRDRTLSIRFYSRYVEEPGAVPSRIEIAHRRLAELRAAERAASIPPAERAAAPAPSAPVGSPAMAPPGGASTDGSSTALTAGAIVAGSVGLVGIGVGVAFGLTAKNDLEESERYCDGNQCISQRGVDAAKSATRAADVATIGFSVGGGLLALGTILWFLDDGEREQPALAGALDWSPHLGPGELSLSVSGSFGER